MLLRDKKLQAELKENGYVVIPFLNPEEVGKLNAFYGEVNHHMEPPDFIEDIHMTTWCRDFEYKERISSTLMELFSKASENYFENCRRLNNVFIVKRSGKQTTFKVHQDWNIIDETKYESVNVWIPLHDVDEKSGALWVLKGSHRINRKIRGAGYLFPDYGPYYEDLQANAISVSLKAGQAIVFYHSVIHGSPPNLAADCRKAACFSVIPEQAPLCIYFQPSATDPLLQYEPDDRFIFRYNSLRTESLVKPPAETPVKRMAPYVNKAVDRSELEPLLRTRKKFFNFWK